MKNKKLLIYLIIIYLICVLSFYCAYILNRNYFFSNANTPSFLYILLFIFLSIIAESMEIRFRSNESSISPGFIITTASIMLFGVFWAMIIVSLGTAFRFVKYNNERINVFNTPLYKTFFNISNMSVSIFISGIAYYDVFSVFNYSDPTIIFLKFIIFVFVFLFVNSLIMTILIISIKKSNLIKVYGSHIRIGFLNIVFVSPLGAILAFLTYNNKILWILFIASLLVILRFVFRLYTEQ